MKEHDQVLNCEQPSAPDSESLDDLIAAITPGNRHGEVDFGAPVGREFAAAADKKKAPRRAP